MKIYRISGKTWRDKKDHVILYHASPNRLSQIGPMSSFRGQAGAFLSPSYKSISMDWAPYVSSKKENTHPLIKKWHQIWDNIREFEKISSKTPQQEAELQNLHNQIDKIEDSFNKVSNEQKGYSKIFIHKVTCPKEVFDQYQKRIKRQQQEGLKNGNFAFWAWGEQIFIDKADLSKLKIIKVEEWDASKLRQKEQDSWLQRYKSQTGWQKSEESDPNMPVPQYNPDKQIN